MNSSQMVILCANVIIDGPFGSITRLNSVRLAGRHLEGKTFLTQASVLYLLPP